MLKNCIFLLMIIFVANAVNIESKLQSNLDSCATGGPCRESNGTQHVIDCNPIELTSDVIFNGICTDDTPCVRCQGECDNDSQCEGALVCFQRDAHAFVPGCLSNGPGDYFNYDYCVDPYCDTDDNQECTPLNLELKTTIVGDGVCTDNSTCGQCQGQCDSDSQCEGALVCFQRNGHTPVPGCTQGGQGDIFDYNYCVHPNCEFTHSVDCSPIELNSDVIFNGICTANTPCGRCMGECDNDSHCAGDLVCFQRDDFTAVPGCLSFGSGDYEDYDYCVEPTCDVDDHQTCESIPLTAANVDDGVCTASTPCPQCHGDCDDDSQCEGEFICFQRNGYESVPSCISGGSGDISDYDYCVHPAC